MTRDIPNPGRFLQLPSIIEWDDGSRHWSWRTVGCSCCSHDVFEETYQDGKGNVDDGGIVDAIKCLQAMHRVIDEQIMELTKELKG